MSESRMQAVLRPFEENRAYMEDRIQSGIEQNRKGWATLEVTDKDGNPVTDATVEVKQLNHEYRFGANLFMLDEMETPEKNENYRKKFAEIFNYGTIPFYWKDNEPEQDKPRYTLDSPRIYRRPNPELCLQYCAENGIEPKAHCLVYEAFRPDWVPDDNVPEMKRLYTKRMQELSERFASRIPLWEVTNETLIDNDRWNTPLARTPDFVDWAFHTADSIFPGNRLLINETQQCVWLPFNWSRSQFYLQVQGLLNRGARINNIGFQYHMFHRREKELENTRLYYDPTRLYNVLDTYAQFNLPMQITEMTIPCYSGDAEDEAVQAEILKNVYSIFFSHSAMDAIVYWNLVDGYAHGAKPGDMTAGENYYYGGMIRFDGSPKPGYLALKKLIHETWHTETAVRTAQNGTAQFKGFYGDYEITIHASEQNYSQKILFTKGGNRSFKLSLPF